MMAVLIVSACVVLGIPVLYLFLIMPRMIRRPDRTPFLKTLYAHRGLHNNESDAPENSMKAFRRAVEAGFGIELDVQLSKDRVPVVFHDFTLTRICGVEGRVEDHTYEELGQFRLCGSEEKIPRFEDVLELVDGRVPLIVEYKIAVKDTAVCELADRLLSKYRGLYCIESFSPAGVLWYRRHKKEIMRGQLAENFVKNGEKALLKPVYFLLHNLLFNFLTKPDFIAYKHQDYRDLSRRLCRYLYGAVAVAWTIKSKEELAARRGDFDMFIFDSFVPAKNQ